MPAAKIPENEASRLNALRNLHILDSGPSAELDAIVKVASSVCGVPISLISLVDEIRQWFKANHGLEGVSETPRDFAFCAHAILGNNILEVSDATQDIRFSDNPLVLCEPNIRFYAGTPITLSSGENIGTLCLIDSQPHVLTEQQKTILKDLGIAASRAIESHRLLEAERNILIAEEAMREAANYAASIFQNTHEPIVATMLDGTITHWNKAAEDLFGYSDVEIIGQNVSLLVPDEVLEQHQIVSQAIISSKDGLHCETKRRAKSGQVIDVTISAAPLYNGTGTLVGLTKIVHDISEEVKTRRLLADNEAKYRVLSEASPLGVFSTNRLGACTYTNACWQEIFDLSYDESLSLAWKIRIHPLDHDAVIVKWQHCEAEQSALDMSFRILHRNGNIRFVHLCASPTFDENQQFQGFVGSVEDITLSNAAIRASEELLGTIRSQFIYSLTDSKGNILEVNDAFCAISQYTRDELIGANHRLINSGVHHHHFFTQLWQTISAGKTWHGEICNRAKDGTLYWVNSVISPLKDSAGNIERYISIRTDITTRKLQEHSLKLANERTQIATKSGGVAIWNYDVINELLDCDATINALYDMPEEAKLTLDSWIKMLHPEDRDVTIAAFQDALKGHSEYDVEFRVIWRDASVHYIRAKATLLRSNDGEIVHMLGTNWDVTNLRELALAVEKEHETLRVTLQSIGDAVITTDANGFVTWLNPVAERMTGWLSVEAKGKLLAQIFNIVNEESQKVAESPVTECLRIGKIVGLASNTILISRDGLEYGIEDSASPIRADDGSVIGVVLVFHDVTEQRRLSREMTYRATHDALTGLANRTEFETRLSRILNKAKSDGSVHTLMFIDLDQFKLVNDACGHTAGDMLLQQVSKILSEITRSRDTLARLGGDEFGVILEKCTPEQAQRVAQIICDRMDEFRFIHDGKRFRIGTSIGLAIIDDRWAGIPNVIQAADAACYVAKEAGRNRVHTWFDDDVSLSSHRGKMQWATRLELALDDNQFELYAQRISVVSEDSDAQALDKVYAEVLIRMRDENCNLILPNAFLPAAERFHLASRIDRWVLAHVIEWLQSLENISLIDTICINLSGQSIGDRAFHAHAIEALRLAGDAICRRICLEITETATVTNMTDASLFIEQVRMFGVRIALDDFGAGASSFGYLKTLKVDVLKIDGQFIKAMINDPLDDSAVRCFVDVANIMGLKTVAEYVETTEILAHVQNLGINFAQGFLIHEPEPIDTLLSKVRKIFDQKYLISNESPHF